MKAILKFAAYFLLTGTIYFVSCQKEINKPRQIEEAIPSASSNANAETPPFNLEAILHGEGHRLGHVKFRQDVDPAKIITLDTWVRGLEPNHLYLLQRAVDAINVVDGNCTSTTWLTLGKGLIAQSILTDDKGTGKEELWRDVSSVATGSKFDIHFRIIDAVSMTVVLDSDCYEYVVR